MYLQIEITGNADDDGIALIADLRNAILKACEYNNEVAANYIQEISEMLAVEAEEVKARY